MGGFHYIGTDITVMSLKCRNLIYEEKSCCLGDRSVTVGTVVRPRHGGPEHLPSNPNSDNFFFSCANLAFAR